jgi:hypothetical protein
VFRVPTSVGSFLTEQSPTEVGTPKHRYANKLAIGWQLAQMPQVGYVIKNYCAAEMLSRLTVFIESTDASRHYRQYTDQDP